jgi:hypothetical protein
MKVLLNIEGKSQYAPDIDEKFQPSACGPTTANILLNFICKEEPAAKQTINELYAILGSTKIGLFKWRLIRNLQALLGDRWEVASCTINEAIVELQNGRPVAMKFDKYFTFHWLQKPTYDYHWVPLIGYEIRAGKLYLMIHDNGGRNRASYMREILYEKDRDVLSFVKITPKTF